MVQRKKDVDGDLFIPGSITVLGGINSSAYRKTVTTLARTEGRVETVELEKAEKTEVITDYFETRYIRSASYPATPEGDDPEGWTLDIPSGSDPIYMSGAAKGPGGVLLPGAVWYDPVQFTNAATLVAMLTNDYAGIPTDVNGDNGNFTAAKSKLIIYEGTEDKTSEFTAGFTADAGITIERLNDSGVVDANGRTVHVTAMTIDAGKVTCSGVRSGTTLTKEFLVHKAKQGDQAPVYSMSVSSIAVLVKPDLSRNPTTLTFTSTSQVGLATPQSYAGRFKFYVDDILWFESEAPQSSYVWDGFTPLYPALTLYPSATLLPRPIFDGQADIKNMTVQLWDADNSVLLDRQTVVFIADWENYREDMLAEVPDFVPRYLGRFNADMPTTYRKGDTWLVYDTDDSPYTRGVYFYNGTDAPFRLTDAASSNAGYIVEALPDILWAVKNGYGSTALYGAVTYIENLVSNAIFTEKIQIGQSKVTDLVTDLGIITAAASAAQDTADAAQAAAEAAQSDATEALDDITIIISDDKLSPDEKPSIVKEYGEITAEQSGIGAKLTAYSLTSLKTAYDNAVTALTAYLGTLTSPVAWNNYTDYTTIVRATFIAKFQDVYTARQNGLNALYTAAESAATTAAASDSTAKRNDIAVKMGYASWSAMEAAAIDGETIIDGGYINTDLIDTDTLIAKNVYVDPDSTPDVGFELLINDTDGFAVYYDGDLKFRIPPTGNVELWSSLIYNGYNGGPSQASVVVSSGIGYEFTGYDGAWKRVVAFKNLGEGNCNIYFNIINAGVFPRTLVLYDGIRYRIDGGSWVTYESYSALTNPIEDLYVPKDKIIEIDGYSQVSSQGVMNVYLGVDKNYGNVFERVI